MAAVIRKHARELIEFLRTEYGAEDCFVQGGGKHNKLKFRCHGSEYSYILGEPSDFRAIRNIHADLKRKLGEPQSHQRKALSLEETIDMVTNTPPPPPKPEYTYFTPDPDPVEYQKTVVQVTPAGEATVSKTWEIKVCAYNNGGTRGPIVWFVFKKSDAQEIQQSYSGGVHIDKLDEEHWKISPGGKHRFVSYGKGIKVSRIEPGMTPFGSSPAEAVEVNGEILVYLPKRLPITPMMPPRPSADASAIHTLKQPKPAPATPPPPPPINLPPGVQQVKVTVQQPMLMTTSTLMEQRMRDIVRQVYDIQDLCPYRLVILPDGRLTWRAPDID
jgi:hypothetical protein